jgi:ClpP class serine protease
MKNVSSKLMFATRLVQFVLWLMFAAVVVIALANWIFAPSVAGKRNSAIRAIQEERDSKVITMIHRREVISILGIPVRSYIDIEDAEKLLRVIREAPRDKPIDLVLHTPGGLVLAASQIAQALQKHDAEVRVFIPHYAMSGGTLIALAADEIIMDPNAVLGPVDPQVGFFPAASILKARELKPVEEIDDHTLILSDIATKAVNQMVDLTSLLLQDKYPADKALEIADTLATGQFTHDYPITVKRAREMGLVISTNVPDQVYKLMDLYAQQKTGRPSVRHVPLESSFRNEPLPDRDLHLAK